MFITITTAVLLGLTWLYVNYGMALFLVALVLIWIASGFAGRGTPVYFDEGSSLALGSDGDSPSAAATAMDRAGHVHNIDIDASMRMHDTSD
jgi:hypothetical protein